MMGAAAISLASFNNRYRSRLVWLFRIVIGGLFVMSGLVKGIDVWGFVFKISEYLTVWGFDQPQSLVLMVAIGLSLAEFWLGAMLLLGCYKRTCVWLMLAMMVGMLPLTLYIYISDPVADCGCFGDFWKISNGATFWKNVVITASLIYLLRNNAKVRGLYNPYIQWLVGLGVVVYLVSIALVGYLVQPVVDFRSFSIGRSVIESADSDENLEFEFIYSHDGREQAFTEDNLPDSTWTFVDRRVVSGSDDVDVTTLSIYDGDDEVSEEVLDAEGEQIIVVLPDFRRANVANTYTVNELQRLIEGRGGSMIELAAVDDDELEQWRDLSMATYPIYKAEPTVLKELSRGDMSIVYLKAGTVMWKRSLASVDTEIFDAPGVDPLEALGFNGSIVFEVASVLLLLWLLALYSLEKMPWFVGLFRIRSGVRAANDALSAAGTESLTESPSESSEPTNQK